jgi:hypothetical protein
MKWDSPYAFMLRNLTKQVEYNKCHHKFLQRSVFTHCEKCGNSIGGVVDLTKPFKN